MRTRIEGGSAFSHIHVELEPGESLVAESQAMVSMSAELDVRAMFNGGPVSGLCKRYLGGESLFVNRFTNPSSVPQTLVLAQPLPGEIREVQLSNQSICLQPGAYVCSTPGLSLGVRWAGVASFLARHGLFKLEVGGTGTLWYGAFGGLVDKQVNGEYLVDSAHLVAYEPQLRLKVQLAGGVFSSLFGGEGLVSRIEGHGWITLQSRSLAGMVGWINPKLRP